MPNIEKLSVEEMRRILTDYFGYTQEQANSIKNKSNLRLELIRLKYDITPQKSDESVSFFEALEVDNTEQNDSEEVTPHSIPEIGDAEWENYVVAHLLENEFYEKNDKLYPKAFGLRRVAQKLLGEIVDSGPVREYAPVEAGHPGRATVVYQIVINWMGNPQDRRTFREAADVWMGNTPEVFNVHPVATASSKAEGRCFKKALQLSLHTAEEIITNDESVTALETLGSEFKDNAPITGAQKSNITRLCERHNIDVVKFITNVYPEYAKINNTSFDGLIKSEGSNLCTILNQYQSKGKDHVDIPEEIKVVNEQQKE